MALLFMDSFDHYATADLQEKWGSVLATGAGTPPTLTITPAAGRRGSQGLRYTTGSASTQQGYCLRALTPSDATCILGFAYSPPASGTLTPAGVGHPLAVIRESITTQITLRLNPDYTLSVVRGPISGAVVLGAPTSVALPASVHSYVELKVTIHNTLGTVDLRINGALALSLTGQDTQQTATAAWTSIGFGGVDNSTNVFTSALAGRIIDWDDLYVLDGSGPAPWNTFLGDCRVDVRYPTAPGATTQFTPSAGANWQTVDDAVPDDDTTHNTSATTGHTDTFVTEDAPVAGATIFGVQSCLNMKKTDAGICSVAPVIRHSGVDYAGAAIAPGTAYAYGLQIAATNPGTAAQWTEAGFNAAEFGYKKTA